MHDLLGEVLFSTFEYGIMRRETSRSGRRMIEAFKLSFLEPMGFYNALRDVLLPLAKHKVGPQSLLDRMLPPGDEDESEFIKALCVLLAGHPRFVAFFLEELAGGVVTLVCESAGESIYGPDLQETCLTCLEEAARQCNVEQSLSVYGGVKGSKRVLAAVFLREHVRLTAMAVTRLRAGVHYGLTWDQLAADGALQVLPVADQKRRVQSRAASSGIASLHPLALLDVAREGRRNDPFFADVLALLMCPGDRLSGERLERFVAQRCVVASHSRKEDAELYSSIALSTVLSATTCAEYVGDHAIINGLQVDASVVRTQVSNEGVLDVLKRADSDPAGALKTVFRLDAGWEPQRQPAADVAEFYEVKEGTSGLKKGTKVLVLYQMEDSIAGGKGSPNVRAASKSWTDIEKILKEDDLWDSWKDRIVFVVVDRHVGNFARTNTRVSTTFKTGRPGKQSVVYTGPDLGGWIPQSAMVYLDIAEFLEQSGIKGGLRSFFLT